MKTTRMVGILALLLGALSASVLLSGPTLGYNFQTKIFFYCYLLFSSIVMIGLVLDFKLSRYFTAFNVAAVVSWILVFVSSAIPNLGIQPLRYVEMMAILFLMVIYFAIDVSNLIRMHGEYILQR